MGSHVDLVEVIHEVGFVLQPRDGVPEVVVAEGVGEGAADGALVEGVAGLE